MMFNFKAVDLSAIQNKWQVSMMLKELKSHKIGIEIGAMTLIKGGGGRHKCNKLIKTVIE